MTTPKISTVQRGGSRFYIDPRDTSKRLPGVTSVLNMLPKPFLKFWASKVVAETAYDNIGTVVQMALTGQREGAIDYLKKAPDRFTGQAADVGSDVHDLLERLSLGESIGAVHPDLQPYIDGFHSFIAQYNPEFLFVEETVWSETHGYAGSFDAIAKIGDETIILDYKTTRSGVHDEVALQMSAYAHADYIMRDDGTTVPLPKIDGAAVLHLRPERTQLVPVAVSEPIFDAFKALLVVHNWDKNLSKGVLGKPLASWAV